MGKKPKYTTNIHVGRLKQLFGGEDEAPICNTCPAQMKQDAPRDNPDSYVCLSKIWYYPDTKAWRKFNHTDQITERRPIACIVCARFFRRYVEGNVDIASKTPGVEQRDMSRFLHTESRDISCPCHEFGEAAIEITEMAIEDWESRRVTKY